VPDVAFVELPPISIGVEKVMAGGKTRLFIEEDDICTSLEGSVGGRETCETTTDNDNASN